MLYCQQHKGLVVYGYTVMSNHVHLMVRAANNDLSDIIRDHKKFTSKKIYEAIISNERESRKEWLGLVLSFNGAIWFWEEGYQGEEVFSESFFVSKLHYMHQTPFGLVGWLVQMITSTAVQEIIAVSTAEESRSLGFKVLRITNPQIVLRHCKFRRAGK